FT
ncbi:hypothetical protein TNIN_456751, partial [Trichonephila inaurata madagascariensis]